MAIALSKSLTFYTYLKLLRLVPVINEPFFQASVIILFISIIAINSNINLAWQIILYLCLNSYCISG